MKKNKKLFTIQLDKPKPRKKMPKPSLAFEDKKKYNRKKEIEPYEL
jgi:hypothetical protein